MASRREGQDRHDEMFSVTFLPAHKSVMSPSGHSLTYLVGQFQVSAQWLNKEINVISLICPPFLSPALRTTQDLYFH